MSFLLSLFFMVGIIHNNMNHAEIILRVDPLALLSTTLRTYQKAACDTDYVLIACPRGTKISIEFAQYNNFIAKDGISIEELCSSNNDAQHVHSKAKHLLKGSTFGTPGQKVPESRYANGNYALVNYNTNSTNNIGEDRIATNITDDSNKHSDMNSPDNCIWPNALQYSLLQTVVEACQKKKHCRFHGIPHYNGIGASGVGDTSGTSSYHSSTMSSTTINAVPCPNRQKIVEIAYKCRPYEFRSKVACHNDVAQLQCNPYSRIAVYSASFGRTEYESIQCPQPQGVREETCLAAYATETVMQICHGRRRCNLAADPNTFGTPCQPNSRMYLKVVYTCVPKQVLEDRFESDIEADENEEFEGEINELYDDELSYKESEAIPNLYSNTTTTTTGNNQKGFANLVNATNVTNNSFIFNTDFRGINAVMTHSADLSLEGDYERLYFYLLIAGSIGVIVCAAAVAVRTVLQKTNINSTNVRSTSSIKSTEYIAETTLPHGFNDNISEIDADIHISGQVSVPSLSKNENYVAYVASNTVYGNQGPSSISQNTAMMMPGSVSVKAFVDGTRESPDIIGISSNTLLPSGNAENVSSSFISTLGSTVLVGNANATTTGSKFCNAGQSSIVPGIPITSLGHYTTAPTIRAGFIVSTDSSLQQQNTTNAPSTTFGENFNIHSNQQATHLLTNAAIQRSISSSATSPPSQHQSSYDGIAPRTHPTGVAFKSQYFYG